jgi:prophage DNA circulation protein
MRAPKPPAALWERSLPLDGKGSFRGVEFFCSSATSDIGRRTVTHEFPGKDTPFVEDLGRAASKYRLEAYVLGADYITKRDRLRREFQTAGPGELVHPFWGRFTVVVDGRVQLVENFDQGGMAKFTLNVVEYAIGASTVIPAVPNTVMALTAKAAVAVTASTSAFVKVFAVLGYVSNVATQAVAVVTGVTDTLNSIRNRVNSVLNRIDTIGESINSFRNAISSLVNLPSSLAEGLSVSLSNVLASVTTLGSEWDSYFGEGETPGSTAGTPLYAPTAASPANGDERVKLLRASAQTVNDYVDSLDPVAETTPTRERQNINQAAIALLVKECVIVAACTSVAEVAYTSAGAALDTRDWLVDAIDDLTELMDDDASYAAFAALRAALVAHLTKTATDLPKLASYTPLRTVPALVLSQELYGSIDLAQDVIERNNVRNPVFVPGERVIEVLSGK